MISLNKNDIKSISFTQIIYTKTIFLVKRFLPARIKNILKRFYYKYLDKYIKKPLTDDNVSYIIAQDVIRQSFLKNRYAGLVEDLLKRKSYKGIIFYNSLVEWESQLFQRPHHIFTELSKRDYIIFYLTPRPEIDNVNTVREVHNNIFVIKDIDFLYGIKEHPIFVWINWTPNIICRELFPNSVIIYDYIDELNVFSYYCEYMERDHKTLLRESHVAIASADILYSEVKELRQDVSLVPNGVRMEDFKIETEEIPEDLEPILAKRRPIIGYYGALAVWLDYDLINFACEQCRDLNFVYIGPSYDGSSEQLKSFDNLYLLGPKKYVDLKYYLKYFDVATIPFQTGEIANSTSPVKLFEYMAGGKPIVTTDMKECAKYRNVLVSRDHKHYIRNLKEALSLCNDKEYIKTLKEEAANNTWNARVAEITKKIEPLARDN
jgi:glycosyltransferase involved in cell wall biosynthesis